MTLVVRPGFAYDTDASNYIDAVEVADTQALETNVRYAINNFVIGCKTDGIWSAIKASCILSGARTLTGALVPLVGSAPTNNNFVSGDYNRKTGLAGQNYLSKYLNSNRSNNLEPQNSKHVAIYKTNANTNSYVYFASGGNGSTNGRVYCDYRFGINTDGLITIAQKIIASGLVGLNRSNGSEITYRAEQQSTVYSQTSSTPDANSIVLYARRNPDNTITFNSDASITFYSIGESLDLTKLEARVTALITAFGAAIP